MLLCPFIELSPWSSMPVRTEEATMPTSYWVLISDPTSPEKDPGQRHVPENQGLGTLPGLRPGLGSWNASKADFIMYNKRFWSLFFNREAQRNVDTESPLHFWRDHSSKWYHTASPMRNLLMEGLEKQHYFCKYGKNCSWEEGKLPRRAQQRHSTQTFSVFLLNWFFFNPPGTACGRTVHSRCLRSSASYFVVPLKTLHFSLATQGQPHQPVWCS